MMQTLAIYTCCGNAGCEAKGRRRAPIQQARLFALERGVPWRLPTLKALMEQGNELDADCNPLAFLMGGGAMGSLIRSMDWSTTPLGPVAGWPQSLRTTVSICLASDLPICVIWGPGLVQLYNDAYRVICSNKNARSMGQNFSECW